MNHNSSNPVEFDLSASTGPARFAGFERPANPLGGGVFQLKNLLSQPVLKGLDCWLNLPASFILPGSVYKGRVWRGLEDSPTIQLVAGEPGHAEFYFHYIRESSAKENLLASLHDSFESLGLRYWDFTAMDLDYLVRDLAYAPEELDEFIHEQGCFDALSDEDNHRFHSDPEYKEAILENLYWKHCINYGHPEYWDVRGHCLDFDSNGLNWLDMEITWDDVMERHLYDFNRMASCRELGEIFGVRMDTVSLRDALFRMGLLDRTDEAAQLGMLEGKGLVRFSQDRTSWEVTPFGGQCGLAQRVSLREDGSICREARVLKKAFPYLWEALDYLHSGKFHNNSLLAQLERLDAGLTGSIAAWRELLPKYIGAYHQGMALTLPQMQNNCRPVFVKDDRQFQQLADKADPCGTPSNLRELTREIWDQLHTGSSIPLDQTDIWDYIFALSVLVISPYYWTKPASDPGGGPLSLDSRLHSGPDWDRCPFAQLSPSEYVLCAAVEQNSSFPLWDLEYCNVQTLLDMVPEPYHHTMADLFSYAVNQLPDEKRDALVYLLLVRMPSVKPTDFSDDLSKKQ